MKYSWLIVKYNKNILTSIIILKPYISCQGLITLMVPHRSSIVYIYHLHDSPKTCAKILQLLKKINPGVPIYGIYGGGEWNSELFKPVVNLLDDNWCFPSGYDYIWKWKNGDLVFCQWFLSRGHHLEWDSFVSYQWDLLLIEPITTFTQNMADNNFLAFPNPKTYEALLKEGWYWITDETQTYEAFKKYIDSRFWWPYTFYGGGSCVSIILRSLMEKMSAFIMDVPGMSEYRIPTLAPLLGYNIQKSDFNTEYLTFHDSYPAEFVLAEAHRPDGARMFHPIKNFTADYDPLFDLY